MACCSAALSAAETPTSASPAGGGPKYTKRKTASGARHTVASKARSHTGRTGNTGARALSEVWLLLAGAPPADGATATPSGTTWDAEMGVSAADRAALQQA